MTKEVTMDEVTKTKQKLYFLLGIPGCGKTTYAKKLISEDSTGLTKRVNKDDLRAMLTGVVKGSSGRVYNREFENVVRDMERYVASDLLAHDYSVVVDDTNLSKKHYNYFKALAKTHYAEFVVCDLTDVSLEICIQRNNDRHKDEQVPEDVVIRMHTQVVQSSDVTTNNVKVDLEGKYLAVDVDGTISCPDHRLHYVKKPANDPKWKKDWNRFFMECGKDKLRLDVKNIIDEYRSMGYPIVFVSARPEYLREMTEKWLRGFGIEYHSLLLRKNRDYRDDAIVKQEILDTYLDKDKIFRWIDDRKRVIDQIRSNGIKVIDVSLGDNNF